ncbi:2Fe-2S iron-sulfur cluster binding domain-containing protein [bacterium AH-315-I20]|nr:2Fe-2S iron-sulfur cluster binding domain-containing protein [bacterium AH-315-I20]
MHIKTKEGIVLEGNSTVSILDTALQNKHIFEYSCKNGQCGVCKTTLVSGDVVELQAQQALTEEDRSKRKILTCCCAPTTDIVIDAEELSALKDIEIKTLPARIQSIEKVSEHIVVVQLRLPPTAQMKFLEGQFIDVLACGVRRSYSIASTADEALITLYIKKLEGGVLSQYWFEDAKPNDLLRIEGPKGSFFFRESKKEIVFLATGTGIAPVKAMLDKLESQAELYQGISFLLFWGNRYGDDFFWEPNYNALNLNYVPVLSRGNSAWEGKTGYIQDILLETHEVSTDMQVYACGSLAMIQSASKVLIDHGLDEASFYSDAFVSS